MYQTCFQPSSRTHSSPRQPGGPKSNSPFQQMQSHPQLVNQSCRQASSQQSLYTSQQSTSQLPQQNIFTKTSSQDAENLNTICRAQGPSTPQKVNIFSSPNNIRALGSIKQDNSFRSSSYKKQPLVILPNFNNVMQGKVCESPSQSQQSSQNKQNYFFSQQQLQFLQIKQSSSGQIIKSAIDNTPHDPLRFINNKENSDRPQHQQSIEKQVAKLLSENKKLNEFIQRQFKEKSDMKQIIDQLQKDQEPNAGLHQMQDRVERLAQVVEDQAQEIEIWKLKYQEVCEQEQSKQYDDQKQLIEQMEKQIMVVVEENERLNNIKQEMEFTIKNQNQGNHPNQKIEELEMVIQDLEDQLSCIKENEQLYQDEIISQRNEKSQIEEDLLRIRHQFEELQGQVFKELKNQKDNKRSQDVSELDINTHSILVANLKQLEKQVEYLSLHYQEKLQNQQDSANLQIQEISHLNVFLKEQNQLLMEEKNSGLRKQISTIDASNQIQEIRETINLSINQIYGLTSGQK